MMLSGSNILCAFLSLACIIKVASGELEPFIYKDFTNDADFSLLGYKSVPSGAVEGKLLPAVIVLPDWGNIDEFETDTAQYISGELGYVGFAADLYGPDLHDVQDFQVKVQQATMLRSDPALFNGRVEAAINAVSQMPEVDPTKIAVIGFCLGGTGVLGYSFSNTDAATSKIVAGVSFHGGLVDFNVTGSMASKVLVLSGGNDDAGTAVEDLEARLKEANATWQITRYSGVEHGFAVPKGDAFNEWATNRSFTEMESFLSEAFSESMYGSDPPVEDKDYIVGGINGNVVEPVDYDQDGFALSGYLAHSLEANIKKPGLVIIPDWDGVNGPTGYEAERAVMANQQSGFVAMVADIYGSEYSNVDDMGKRVELATKYRSDPDLFVSRIQTAIDQLMAHPMVDSSNIYVAGYCLGGTGAIDYAFSSGALENVKAVVPIHGGLSPLRAVQTDKVSPYVLILSGGVDDAHGNTTELELQLDAAGATWEITRYSNAQHGFTKWGSGAYDAMADSRSWNSMMTLFSSLHQTSLMEAPDTTIDMVQDTGDDVDAEDMHDGDKDHEDKDQEDHGEEGEDTDGEAHDSHDHSSSEDEAMMDESSANRALAGLSATGAAAALLVAALF